MLYIIKLPAWKQLLCDTHPKCQSRKKTWVPIEQRGHRFSDLYIRRTIMNDKMSFFQITKPEGQNRNVDLLVKPSLTICFFRNVDLLVNPPLTICFFQKVWGNETPVLPLNDEDFVFPEQKSPKGKIAMLTSRSNHLLRFVFSGRYEATKNQCYH